MNAVNLSGTVYLAGRVFYLSVRTVQAKQISAKTGQRLTRWGQITSARMPEAEYGTRYLAGAINIWQPMRKELRQLRTAKQWSQRSGAS